jgi:transcription initiation factor IIE alpha subunit
MQGISRIVRQFSQGKLAKQQAALMLKKGFGFTDNDVNEYLGIDDDPLTEDAKFSCQHNHNEVDVAEMFEQCGESREQYIIMSSEDVNGEDEDEAKFAFNTAIQLPELELKVADILKKEPKVANDAIAKALNIGLDKINAITDKLINDNIIQVDATSGIRKVVEKTATSNLPEIKIMYSYELRSGVSGPELLPTSRPFCQKMIKLKNGGRLYSRADIQKISERLGYSVFNRSGGFWNNNGEIEKQCRHFFKRNVVIKKR